MKCYIAGSANPQEYDWVEACFANTSKEAKAFMWKNSHRLPDECNGEYMELRVNRRKDHDKFFDQSKTEPYIVSDNKTLREMGWKIEGDDTCCGCGLAEMEGEFPVCEDCDYCEDCGHDDECERS